MTGENDGTSKSAIEKFENLAAKLFSIAKDDAAKVAQVAEEAADNVLPHPKEPAEEAD